MRDAIKQTFGNCKSQHKCLCTQKDSFELTEENHFFIYDEKDTEQPVRIVSAGDNYQLTVNNPNLKSICIIKTDNCLLTDDTSKCDCVLFDNSKLFFVEIKTSSSGSRGNKRKKAIEQLGITIDLFQQTIDFSNFDTSAIICFKQIEPRITSAQDNTARALFLATHKVKLEERNFIDF